jgi:hypothetical protein
MMVKRMSSNLMCLIAVDQEVFGLNVDQEEVPNLLPTACKSLQPSMTSRSIMIPK